MIFNAKTIKKNHENLKNIRKNATYVYKNLSDEPKTNVHFWVRQTTWEQKNTQKITIYETLIHQNPMILR